MELNGVEVEDTFAEAFSIKVARMLITGATIWLIHNYYYYILITRDGYIYLAEK